MLQLSDAEIAAAAMTPDTLKDATRHLNEAGYVTLNGAIPTVLVDQLRARFDRELTKMQEANPKAVEDAKGHCGVSPLLEQPFLDAMVIENPFAMQVLRASLGERIYAYLPYGCNTSWPGSGVQHLHRDTGHLFPELATPLPMSLAVVNIPLVDFTEENGATEAWPGSHLIVDPPDKADISLEERAAHLPSARLTAPVGSLIVRDMRCWHRGMPNQTDTIRTMIALVYFRQFHYLPDDANVFRPLPRGVREGLSDGARSIYRHHPVESN
jgi:hypothetical protein